jgi:hypothetical protein
MSFEMVINYSLRRLLGFRQLMFMEQEATVREGIKCWSREPSVIAALCSAVVCLFVLMSLVFLGHSWLAALVGAFCAFVATLFAYILWGQICATRYDNDCRKWSTFCYLKSTARLKKIGLERQASDVVRLNNLQLCRPTARPS